jgi:uncharacterized membrane protein YbaN (DUF454 family)
VNKIKKVIYIALGLISISIGVIVRFVPGIPTTPFLLLALFCFNKSSERLSRWLKSTYIYKKYLEDYVKTRSMSRKQKVSIQIFASIMMAISFIAVDNLIFRVVMVMMFLAHHYVFIFSIKTYKGKIDEKEELHIQRESKKHILFKMVALFCGKKHSSPKGELCLDCKALLDYAYKRCDDCPQMATGVSCKRCKTPCYKPEMKDKMRVVMRWSGPRILLHHPIAVIKYKAK